jgi:integrase/recombinase XerD
MDPRFNQFIQERKYLKNVSPRTLEWYGEALRWLGNPSPDEAALKNFVVRMREKGLKPVSCNSYISAVNAYVRWTGSPLKIQLLKDEQRILPTFSPADIQKIVRWRPKGFCPTRLHVLLLMLTDTGCRLSEATELRWPDVDMDNLLLKLHGKGAKDRLVPFSFELRRHLFRWKQLSRWDLVFPARNGQRLGRRNELRDVKLLCKQLGIAAPPRTLHAFRHTFAVNYLRRGGSVFHLQKMLGHSTLEMTRRYANLMTEDLQAIHQRVSLLG